MAAVCRASEWMCVCIPVVLVALGWDFCLSLWDTLGYVTFGLVCVLPMFNTFWQTWKLKAVAGGTRGEPVVASLLSYGCYLFLSFMDSQWKFNEPVWISGIGLFFYVVYLMLFLITIEHTDQRHTLTMSIVGSLVYLTLVIAVGLVTWSIPALKWLCMMAGLVSASAPLLLTFFVVEQYVENLPDWFSSASGVLYYSVWMVRAYIPELDLFDLVTNLSGLACSVIFVALLFIWRKKHKPAAGQPEELAAPLLEQNANQDAEAALNVRIPIEPHLHQEPAPLVPNEQQAPLVPNEQQAPVNPAPLEQVAVVVPAAVEEGLPVIPPVVEDGLPGITPVLEEGVVADPAAAVDQGLLVDPPVVEEGVLVDPAAVEHDDQGLLVDPAAVAHDDQGLLVDPAAVVHDDQGLLVDPAAVDQVVAVDPPAVEEEVAENPPAVE